MGNTENLEKRLYFFVPYNLSPIQQAIQAGHAALEYARKYQNDPDFIDFADNWKTWIILNGGTTNSKLLKDSETGWYANPRTDEAPYLGSLDNIAHQLIKNKINYSLFQEPDLNDALTAVCFIADTKVWDWENYPNFRNWLHEQPLDIKDHSELRFKRIKNKSDYSDEDLLAQFAKEYLVWVEFVGGIKNAFLKDLIEGKKLA